MHKIHINGETGYPICKNNGTEIEFIGVNNGNFQDTFEAIAVNGDYLETQSGISLDYTRQYAIDSSGEPTSPIIVSPIITLSVNLGLGEKVVWPLEYSNSILLKLDNLN